MTTKTQTTQDPKKALKSVSDIPTVSGKIRSLDKQGFTKAQIAGMLGKRYQHVYNVLTQDAVKAAAQTS